MTLACCWLDKSFGQKKITALADGRASIKVGNDWIPQNDATPKLYKIPIACFRLSNFNPHAGGWYEPYYTTDVGIAFSGACYEAMSVIALYQRFLGTLASSSEDATAEPRPEPQKLVEILVVIIDKWSAAGTLQFEADFLLFGFSPQDGNPWCAHIRRAKGAKAALINYSNPLEVECVYFIGDGLASRSSKEEIERVRSVMRRKARRMDAGEDEEDRFQYRLQRAKLGVLDKKYVEQSVLDQVASDEKATVGGVLQKLQIYGIHDHRGVAAFSRHAEDFDLDALPRAGDQLSYIPLVEQMGQTGERPRWQLEEDSQPAEGRMGEPLSDGIEAEP